MKKIYYIIIFACLSISFASCEKDLPLYNSPDNLLNLEVRYDEVVDSVTETPYSFIYTETGTTEDTIWIKVSTVGFLSNENRSFELQQVKSGKDDAIENENFVSFDDPTLKSKYYFIPANKTEAKIPIVIKRSSNLKKGDKYLYISLKENENFKKGYSLNQIAKFSISDKLSKPSEWKTWSAVDYYFGTYGVEKHKIMIEATGFKWDNDFIKNDLGSEYGYIAYLNQMCIKRLEEVNALRKEQGLGVLCEEDGTPVAFKNL